MTGVMTGRAPQSGYRHVRDSANSATYQPRWW